jgi:hypothetical protein
MRQTARLMKNKAAQEFGIAFVNAAMDRKPGRRRSISFDPLYLIT